MYIYISAILSPLFQPPPPAYPALLVLGCPVYTGPWSVPGRAATEVRGELTVT